MWKPDRAKYAWEIEQENNIKLHGIKPDDLVIILYPHEMILGHTIEFVGGQNVVVPEISGKSTAGRNMIEMCSDANMGNVGSSFLHMTSVANPGIQG